jgi:hypothetical protein
MRLFAFDASVLGLPWDWNRAAATGVLAALTFGKRTD